jgi:WD40 repeat protein
MLDMIPLMVAVKPVLLRYFQRFLMVKRFYWVYLLIISFGLLAFLTFFNQFSSVIAQLPSRELYTLQGHNDSVWSVAFSPDGQLLASGSQDKTVKLWEVKTGTLLHTLQGHDAAVFSIAFSPNGRLLASGSWDSTVKLWQVSSGNQQLPSKDGSMERA